MEVAQTPSGVDSKIVLPQWAAILIYLLDRVGLPLLLLCGAGYYGVQHLERVGRHLEKSDEVQAALAKEIAGSREESKAARQILEKLVERLEKQ